MNDGQVVNENLHDLLGIARIKLIDERGGIIRVTL